MDAAEEVEASKADVDDEDLTQSAPPRPRTRGVRELHPGQALALSLAARQASLLTRIGICGRAPPPTHRAGSRVMTAPLIRSPVPPHTLSLAALCSKFSHKMIDLPRWHRKSDPCSCVFGPLQLVFRSGGIRERVQDGGVQVPKGAPLEAS